MSETFHYYFSLQYSGIQKTILRHDRLWSISGISMMLSDLNEIKLPEIARNKNGMVLVAGGGKFTARFDNPEQAEQAKEQSIKEISTTLPMLEFQASQVVSAKNLAGAKAENEDKSYPGIVNELKEKKQGFRGYGVSFNPHMMLCQECGEYPVITDKYIKEKNVCSVCCKAHSKSSELKKFRHKHELTTLEKIYDKYFEETAVYMKFPYNFDDLFPDKAKKQTDQRKRMAVWLSDINSMRNKVSVWLNQEDKNILPTFQKVNKVFIDIAADALVRTFPNPGENIPHDQENNFLPFRLTVAGGDDLCVVMSEKYILDFVLNLSRSLHSEFRELTQKDSNHPLSEEWLKNEKKKTDQEEEPKDGRVHKLGDSPLEGGVVRGHDRLSECEQHPPVPPQGGNIQWFPQAVDTPPKDLEIEPYCFGGSFIVTSIHTPFKKIHEIGEDLMKTAKLETKRKDNSVNWRIMAEEFSQTEKLMGFERSVFIEKKIKPDGFDRLSFCDYAELCEFHSEISSSHRQQIIAKMIECKNDPYELERWLMIHGASELGKSFTDILEDEKLRSDRVLVTERIAKLFELLSIERNNNGKEK